MSEALNGSEVLTPNERLREHLARYHVTQSGLARDLGISPTYFHFKIWKKFGYDFTPAEWTKLEEILRVPLVEKKQETE